MSGLYASDQSFSGSDVDGDSSLIFYSVYKSDWEPGLRWVAKQKGMNRLPLSEELKYAWHADEVHSDEHHILFARYPGMILMFSTSSELNEIDPDIVLEKIPGI